MTNKASTACQQTVQFDKLGTSPLLAGSLLPVQWNVLCCISSATCPTPRQSPSENELSQSLHKKTHGWALIRINYQTIYLTLQRYNH